MSHDVVSRQCIDGGRALPKWPAIAVNIQMIVVFHEHLSRQAMPYNRNFAGGSPGMQNRMRASQPLANWER